jgi:hypothetical protein
MTDVSSACGSWYSSDSSPRLTLQAYRMPAGYVAAARAQHTPALLYEASRKDLRPRSEDRAPTYGGPE